MLMFSLHQCLGSFLWVVVVKSGSGSCCHDLEVGLLCATVVTQTLPDPVRPRIVLVIGQNHKE